MRIQLQSRVLRLETSAASKDAELQRLRETVHRVGSIAGSLLDSCSDFDKLWILHSKKVFTQIQTMLAHVSD